MTPALAIPAGLAGAAVGSFVALVADRWPRGEDVVATPSHCRGCGRRLGAANLIPVISYVMQRGRCRWCAAPLPADLLLAELAGGAIGVVATTLAPTWPGMLIMAALGFALLLLALLDARHLWLPDAVTLPLLLAGLATGPGALALVPGPDLLDRILGAVLGYVLLQALRGGYRALRGREGLGGGDPKLLGAIGAWLGAAPLPGVVLGAALFGLGWAALQALRGRAAGGQTPIPLGTGLAVAALMWIAIAPV
ncbi:prepilin peptidase [Novosphingobium sp.]|uniref:prepilin peptidase n=1 Tax=Novosphingobium sp. TaxID=1874826 RepID=UPI00333FD2ED